MSRVFSTVSGYSENVLPSADRNLLSPLTCGDLFLHVLESTLVLMGMCVQQRLALPRVNEVFLCDVKSDRASD